MKRIRGREWEGVGGERRKERRGGKVKEEGERVREREGEGRENRRGEEGE